MRALYGVVALVGAEHVFEFRTAEQAEHTTEHWAGVCEDLLHAEDVEGRCTSHWGWPAYKCSFIEHAVQRKRPGEGERFCNDMYEAFHCANFASSLYTSNTVTDLLKAKCLEQSSEGFCSSLVARAKVPTVQQLRDSLELCYPLEAEVTTEAQAVPTSELDEDNLENVHVWRWAQQLGVLALAGVVIAGLGVLYMQRKPRVVSIEPFLGTEYSRA